MRNRLFVLIAGVVCLAFAGPAPAGGPGHSGHHDSGWSGSVTIGFGAPYGVGYGGSLYYGPRHYGPAYYPAVPVYPAYGYPYPPAYRTVVVRSYPYGYGYYPGYRGYGGHHKHGHGHRH